MYAWVDVQGVGLDGVCHQRVVRAVSYLCGSDVAGVSVERRG